MGREGVSDWTGRFALLARRSQRALDRAEALDRRAHQAMIDAEVAMSIAEANDQDP